MSTPSNTPLVTVYIATHNRRWLLTRALESVWAQGRRDIEVVVVDDGSEDETAGLLVDLESKGRLRWFRNDHPQGACAARNRAIQEARGHYVTGLDDDDEMLPERIDVLLAALTPQDAFVCASDWIVAPERPRQRRVAPPRIDAAAILARNVAGNQILAERCKVLACGGFDETLPSAQDYDLWIRMILRHGPARGLSRPLQIVHVHGASPRISASPARRRGYWTVYQKHKAVMVKETRASHLYNLHKASQKSLGMATARAFFVRGNRLRVLSRLLIEAFPGLATKIQTMAGAYLRMASRPPFR